MTKYAPRTSTAAVKWAKSKVGHSIYTGMCQAFTVTAFGTGGVGDFDGDRDADAVDGWKAATKRVHAKDIKDFTKIPAGVALYWSGGSRGFGHAAVSIGGGQMVTTDRSSGRVGIAPIKGWWSGSHHFLGYVLVEGNGHTLTDPPKPAKIRFVTWNVALNFKRAGLADRTNRIARKLKGWRVDFVAVQECPTSGDGSVLFPKLKGIDLDKRVGSHGRYVIFRSSVTTVHDWVSLNFGEKRATVVYATIRGHEKVIVNCHSRSGSDAATRAHRGRWANKVIDASLAFAKGHDVSAQDVIFLGDFNGGEFAEAAKAHSFGRGRSYSAIKTALIRTYNGWGKKHKDAGGQFDYGLFHLAFLKAKRVLKAKTFFTPRASDHNAVFFEIKE